MIPTLAVCFSFASPCSSTPLFFCSGRVGVGVCSRLSLGLWGCSLDWGEAYYYVLLLLFVLLSLPFVFGV